MDWILIVIAVGCLAIAAWLTLRSKDSGPPAPAPRGNAEDASAQQAEPEEIEVETEAPSDPEALHQVRLVGRREASARRHEVVDHGPPAPPPAA